MEPFIYTYKSQTICYHGYVFDSLLELKYALMVQDTHAWLRSGLEIYYNINRIPNGIKRDLGCYRPDFLIRNWVTGAAELIEIKPDGFCDDSLRRRTRIANRYINKFGYDWTFRIITESDIHLTDSQHELVHQILGEQEDWKHQPCLRLLQNNAELSDHAYDCFVRTGCLPSFVP